MFIVAELQTNNGITSCTPEVFGEFLAAESRYHDILHYAAASQVEIHGAIMFTNAGSFVKSEYYEH